MCSGQALTGVAASSDMRAASSSPWRPVQALALPALTTTPRIFPRLRRRRLADSRTGAALTRLLVNTAAVETSSSATIRPTSSPPFFLIPAATPAKRNPRTVVGMRVLPRGAFGGARRASGR